MSFNLNRNLVPMGRALDLLADSEQSLDECSSCFLRAVIVSEAQAVEHNRSIVDAKAAIGVLRENLQRSQEEVRRHLQQAQIRFLENRSLSWLQVILVTQASKNLIYQL